MIKTFPFEELKQIGFELVLCNKEILRMINEFNLPFEYLQYSYYVRKNQNFQITDALAVHKYGHLELVIFDEQSVVCALEQEMKKIEAEFTEKNLSKFEK